MHLAGDITFGNILTVISIVVGCAFTGGKLVEVLKMLAADVTEIKAAQEQFSLDQRQHEKDDAKAFGEIHERLIEIALHRRPEAPSRAIQTPAHTERQ